MPRIVYGLNAVRECIKAAPGDIDQICYSSAINKDLLELIHSRQIQPSRLAKESKSHIDRLTGTSKHQGIAAIISSYSYSTIEDILDYWKKSGDKAFILVLDGIQDPHNLGAIIRTAEGAGVHGIILPKDRAAGISPTVEKVSAGATAYTRIAQVTNISRSLELLKKEGLWIAGIEGDQKQSIYDQDFDSHMALVIGGEGSGIRPLVKKQCDFIFSIPMRGKITSLNASVAAAIVLYEFIRQRV